MSQFHFPTREEREKLIAEMEQVQKEASADITSSQSFRNYTTALKEMNELMGKLSQPAEGSRLPKELTQADKTSLLRSIQKVGEAGEKFLEDAVKIDGANLKKGLPGTVVKLQTVLSKDYESISDYDPASRRSLPELQEGGRTLTVDMRGRSLGTVGNMSSSRIPMTLTNSQGKKRMGFFTKANYVHVLSDYNAIIRKAKESCTDQGKAELDKLLGKIREKATEIQVKKEDGAYVNGKEDDTFFAGYLAQALHSRSLTRAQRLARGFSVVNLKTKTLKPILTWAGIDTRKISSKAMETLRAGLEGFCNKPTNSIFGCRLQMKEGDRLDNRNTAMSRVASLLGVSSLLARSDNMKLIDENGQTIEGTFMDYGNGIDLLGHPRSLAAISSDPFDDPEANKTTFRQLADMQVLDFLCLNVDRHMGNMVYQIDEFGRVCGLQGIDNDSSFGRRMHDLNDVKDLQVISESMAKKILNLKPEMLQFSLRGLGLDEKEIETSTLRLMQLQTAILNKMIKRVHDDQFGKFKIEELYPDEFENSNLFKSVHRSFKSRIRNARENYGRQDLEEFRGKPEYSHVSTADRKFSVGGVRDSVMNVVRMVKDDDTNTKIDDLITYRGASENFRQLVASVKTTADLQKTLMEQKDAKGRRLVDDDVRLNEAPAWKILEKTSGAFEDMATKATTYLLGKMEERRVNSIEELRGKNTYEQQHIDFAKKVLKAVDEYYKQTAEPENEAEKEEMMAQDDRRLIEGVRSFKTESEQKNKNEIILNL